MTGSELLLPDRMTVRGAGDALAARLGIANGAQREGDRVYYDTFDGLLHGAGLSLLHAEGRLSVIERDTGLVRATHPIVTPARPLFASEPQPHCEFNRENPSLQGSRPLIWCEWLLFELRG